MSDPWIPASPVAPPAPPQDGFVWFDAPGVYPVEAQWEGWGLHLV